MSKLLFAARIVAAVPLLGIGFQHLLGIAPIEPILEGAGLPFPELGAAVAPAGEVLAGLLLLLGLFPRIGGLVAVGSMLGALVAHARFDWADEPPLALPILVLAFAALVVVKGPGALAVHGGALEGGG
jgi:putative oxidoreductase